MKPDAQFYPTPPDAVRQLVRAAALRPGMTVLEPSAGTGMLVIPALAAKCRVLAIEREFDLVEFLLFATRWVEKEVFDVWRADFLCVAFRPDERFDRVLMNPPFNPDLDILHVLHAWDGSLKDGGLLLAIITPRFLRARGREAERLRSLVKAHGSMTRLPDNHEPGATRITVLLKLKKP